MKDYEVLASERVFDGFFKMHRIELSHRSFRGGWCEPIVRERVEELSAVAVLLYDPLADAVVLVEQFRIGMLGIQDPPWSLEVVAGFCDKAHERPDQAARREVVEETGCEVTELREIGSFFVSPGFSVEQISLFIGRIDSRQAAGIHGLPEEGEEIRVVVMPRTEAVQALFGRLSSTSVLIALQWLERHRQELLESWGLLDQHPG